MSKQIWRNWFFYFAVVLASVFIHELGHCIVAWCYGVAAVPTPAKEYTLNAVPTAAEKYISAGGVVATILIAVISMLFFVRRGTKKSLIIMAGSLASPFLYAVLFAWKGRGHDDTEFQQAQAVMGFNYSGHMLDWLFIVLVVTAFILWIVISKPVFKNFLTFVAGALCTFVFLVALQEINNAIFDPIFGS